MKVENESIKNLEEMFAWGGAIPTDQELAAMFHHLWTRDVGRDGYQKRVWMLFQSMLYRRGIKTDQCGKLF
jgi:hypothetical protein